MTRSVALLTVTSILTFSVSDPASADHKRRTTAIPYRFSHEVPDCHDEVRSGHAPALRFSSGPMSIQFRLTARDAAAMYSVMRQHRTPSAPLFVQHREPMTPVPHVPLRTPPAPAPVQPSVPSRVSPQFAPASPRLYSLPQLHGPHVFRPGQIVDCAVPLFDCVDVRDRRNIAPNSCHVIVAVRDPRIPARECVGPVPVVFVEVCVPPCPLEDVDVSRDGTRIELDYGKYEIDLTSRRGEVIIDYDD